MLSSTISTRRLGEVVRGELELEDGEVPKLPGLFPVESINPSISVVVPVGRLFLRRAPIVLGDRLHHNPRCPISGGFLGRFVRFLCSKNDDSRVVAPLQIVLVAARIPPHLPV